MSKGLSNINSVLNGVIRKLGVDRGLRESTLKNMWPEVVGDKFKKSSKLVSVIKKGNYDVLLVAVYTASVSQELMLFKSSLLKKISPIAHSLEFFPKDIIFNTKMWMEFYEETDKIEESVHILIKKPIDSELKDIQVPENLINQIKESISSQNFSTPEMKDRMMNTILKDIKTQIWRKNNGFPICENCGIPLNIYKKDETPLCPSCKYN